MASLVTSPSANYISTGSLEAAERGAADDGNGESGGERGALQHDATHTRPHGMLSPNAGHPSSRMLNGSTWGSDAEQLSLTL